MRNPITIKRGWKFMHLFLFDYSIFSYCYHSAISHDGVYYFCFRFFDNHGLMGVNKKNGGWYLDRFYEEGDYKIKSVAIFGWIIRIL